ncbi:DUF317 domain-containing protein [Streptomyces sp. NPDC088745]|uniref:DUF317 domain-containing protein n=1 Tax=Streptomyces sp. NPDC088745 TaxID=3365884 RepID=UPI003821D8FC
MTFDPYDRVLVSPRYLAGAGLDRLGEAIGPLVNRAGWSTEQDRTLGTLAVFSPDCNVTIALDTGHQRGDWWTVSQEDPSWRVKFTRQTPIEAIGPMLYLLPQITLGDHRFDAELGAAPPALHDTAGQSAWSKEELPDGVRYTSPDGHCSLEHTPQASGEQVRWVFQHSVFDGFDTHWTATFSATTPQPLVDQFFSNLASGFPVERTFIDLPFILQGTDEALITPVHGTRLNPGLDHAVAQIARIPETPPARRR